MEIGGRTGIVQQEKKVVVREKVPLCIVGVSGIARQEQAKAVSGTLAPFLVAYFGAARVQPDDVLDTGAAYRTTSKELRTAKGWVFLSKR